MGFAILHIITAHHEIKIVANVQVVQSEVNVGSTFTIYLRKAPSPQAEERNEETENVEALAGR